MAKNQVRNHNHRDDQLTFPVLFEDVDGNKHVFQSSSELLNSGLKGRVLKNRYMPHNGNVDELRFDREPETKLYAKTVEAIEIESVKDNILTLVDGTKVTCTKNWIQNMKPGRGKFLVHHMNNFFNVINPKIFERDYKEVSFVDEVYEDAVEAISRATEELTAITESMSSENDRGADEAAVVDPVPNLHNEDSIGLVGSNSLPAMVELAQNVEVPAGDIVKRAFEDSGMSTQEWNELDEDVREALILAARSAMMDEESSTFPAVEGHAE